MYPPNDDLSAWNIGQPPAPYPNQTPQAPYPGYPPQQNVNPGVPAGQPYYQPQPTHGSGPSYQPQQPGAQPYYQPQQPVAAGAAAWQGAGGHGQLPAVCTHSPTLVASPNFNPDDDCAKLRKAMKGLGTDEDAIIAVLSSRTADQRAQLVLKYKTIFGRDLISDLKSELSGKFEDVVVAMCCTLDELDARELRAAMKGAGTDEDTLIEILATRRNAQIRSIKGIYTKLFKRDLEKDLKSETHGHFEKILVSLVQGNRDENPQVDMASVQRDAEELYRAGEKRLGTDESTFNRILVAKSLPHVQAVIEAYGHVSKTDLEKAIKSEMSGDLERCHLAIVRCIRNPAKYFAGELKRSMQGAGTNDTKLIRIVVSRCEIDMGDIKREFERENGKSLAAWIKDDCSGDYRKMLLALIK